MVTKLATNLRQTRNKLATNSRQTCDKLATNWRQGGVMALRAPVKPEFFRWACERGNFDVEDLSRRSQLKKLPEWVSGKSSPTLKQLEAFAKATYVPVGYFFLEEPPVEDIPIPDFRTVGNKKISRPSPDLLDTIYLCERRQDWHHEYLVSQGEEPLEFVGSVDMSQGVESVAEKMHKTLGFSTRKREKMGSWEEAFRLFAKQVEEIGIMVMVSGVVGSNNKRTLNIEEFRGFALSDPYSPLIFVNGQDSKAAQSFTLAHELAHIWLGQSALSDTVMNHKPSREEEIWCNKVAAEFLVPLKEVKEGVLGNRPLESVSKLTKKYKVSSLVIIRRLLDAGFINKKEFEKGYEKELGRLSRLKKASRSGGDFYRTLHARASKRFVHDVIVSTMEGGTQFTEAFRLLGIKKLDTFDKIGRDLGII